MQLSNMEAQSSSVVRSTFTQTNFSTSTKDPEDYAINKGVFHHNPQIGETFATWCIRNSDIYKNGMVDFPHATRIVMLIRKFNRSDQDLYFFYLQPIDPTDITLERRLVS